MNSRTLAANSNSVWWHCTTKRHHTFATFNYAAVGEATENVQRIKLQIVGEFDFLRVLTTRKTFFNVNLRYVAALSDLATANSQIEGLLLTGGLSNVASYSGDDGLRGQALSGQ